MQQIQYNDFLVGQPSDWIDSSHVILIGPARNNYSPNITIVRENLESQRSSQEYAAEQLPKLQQQFQNKNYEIIKEEPFTLGNLSVYQRIHTFSMPELEAEIKQWQIYVIAKNNDAITITCTDKVETFEQSYTTFAEAVQQFSFVK